MLAGQRGSLEGSRLLGLSGSRYLEKPLNGRKVIWVDDDVELPLFVPDW